MSDTTTDAAGPLSGIKVVDFSVMISGPLAAMQLGDQGADVIKVESPGLGDIMRYLGTQKNGMTGIFANSNRGKRSIVVNLKDAAGVDVAKRLVAEADVLIQNFRPGAMERLGLGYEQLHELNPDLIYASISGYGADGPSSGRRAYDNVIQAASGLASVQTDPADGEPQLFRTLLCDKTTAYTVTQAVTAALFARATGRARGQHLEIAMLDTAIAFMWPDSAMDAALLDDDAVRTPTIAANYSVTPFADGFAAWSAVTDSEFVGLCSALGRPDIAADPRFVDTPTRSKNAAELRPLLVEAAAHRDLDDFVAGSIEHDVPSADVRTLDDLPTDPQVVHNEIFVTRQHPQAGMIREPRSAARFSETPPRVGDPAPASGQHTDEILTELGLDPSTLRSSGVVA